MFLVLLFSIFPKQVFAQTPIYKDSTASVEDRVNDLFSRMSLDEKIGQMTQADLTALSNIADVKNYLLGSVLNGGGSDPADNSAIGWADMYDGMQAQALQTFLKIPMIYGVDAVHGHNNVYGAVFFPHNIGLGCTRNPQLIKRMGQITAEEVAATGIDWTFAPCVAVVRDERWGRTYESFGETPEINQLMGSAEISGLQGDTLSNLTSILATVKHFIGDGGTNKGIDQGNTVCDTATLKAIFLPPYKSAIDSGALSIMASYNSWNGLKVHGSHYLLTDLLKGELGFKGFIVSDWAGIDQLPGDYTSDVKTSINAGMDMVMVPHQYINFISTLKSLVLSGDVPQSRIDDAVKRILRVKFKIGLFEHPFTSRSLLASVGSVEHREVARQCVRESLVLLKKKDGVLPLAKNGARILVAGSHANNIGYQCGGWTIDWQGRSGNITPGTTIVQGIINAAATSEIVFSETGDFANSKADYSVVIVGETPYAEGAGDRDDLSLDPDAVALIKKMKSYGNPVITILITGRPMLLQPILHYSDAIIAAWLPGTEGEGIADVLYGDHQPSGQLSITWPKSMAQIPINIGDTNYDPLFKYGFGITSLENSPFGSSPEYQSSIVTTLGNSIELSFNKKIDPTTLLNAQFKLTQNGQVTSSKFTVAIKDNDSTTIILNLDNTFSKNDSITVEYLSGSIKSIDTGVLQPFGSVDVFNDAANVAVSIPGVIEAEDYTAMSGIQTEPSSDTGGGYNVGYIDNNDWVEYQIQVPNSGSYSFNIRVAALTNSGSVTINSGGQNVSTFDLPVTGGWQTWTTVSKELTLNQGVQSFRILAVKGGFNINWFSFSSISENSDISETPKIYSLEQNFPNPFNPATTVRYSLPVDSKVVIKISNVLGQDVKLLRDEIISAGNHEVQFNSSTLPSGVYFYRLSAVSVDGKQKFSSIKKIILLK